MGLKIVMEVYGQSTGSGLMRHGAEPEYVEISEEDLRELAMTMSSMPRELITEVRPLRTEYIFD